MAQLIHLLGNQHPILVLFVALSAFALLFQILFRSQTRRFRDDGLPIANRRRWWEPDYFARLRWIMKAPQILSDADEVVSTAHYRH